MERHLREDDENAGASLERMAGTNGYGRYGLKSLLKIDTGKWYCARRGAVSIKVHRGPLSVCEKLINTKVSFIRPPSCRYSHIISRAGNKKAYWACICKPRDCMPTQSYRRKYTQTVYIEIQNTFHAPHALHHHHHSYRCVNTKSNTHAPIYPHAQIIAV